MRLTNTSKFYQFENKNELKSKSPIPQQSLFINS